MAAKIAIEIRPCGRRATSSTLASIRDGESSASHAADSSPPSPVAMRQDRFRQLPDGVEPLHLFFGNVGAEALLERGQQLDALHRVEAEIELEIGVGHDRRARTRGLRIAARTPRRQGARARHGRRPRVPVHRRRGTGRLVPYPPLDLEPPDLPGCRARQRLAPDLISEHALVVRQVTDAPSISKRSRSPTFDDLALLQQFLVGDDDGIQPFRRRLVGPGQAQHADFLDERRPPIDRLDLLGVDVLAGTEDDELLAAAGDHEPALGVARPRSPLCSQPSASTAAVASARLW